MREITIPGYEAFDGTKFTNAKECKIYEEANRAKQLSGLTIEQVTAAINRTDLSLADAFEEIGITIRKARQEAGELRRKPSARESEPAAQSESQPAPAAAAPEAPPEPQPDHPEPAKTSLRTRAKNGDAAEQHEAAQ